MVNAGKNYIGDVVNEDLEALVKAGQLVATANFCRRGEVRLRVPSAYRRRSTLTSSRTSATSAPPRRASCRTSIRTCIVVLESTTYPGTTEELMQAPSSKRAPVSNAARTFTLPSRPSALIRATSIYKTKNTPKVVGGCIGAKCTEIAAAMYETVLEGAGLPSLFSRRRRDGEDPREHLPQREHRPRSTSLPFSATGWASISGK